LSVEVFADALTYLLLSENWAASESWAGREILTPTKNKQK